MPEGGRLLPKLGALPELYAYLPGVAGVPRASPLGLRASLLAAWPF